VIDTAPDTLDALKELVAAVQDGLRRHNAGDQCAIGSNMIAATLRQAIAVIHKIETS
jgi:hypothetical protein